MKKILLVTASLIALGAPAFGADLAAQAPRTYTKAPAMMPAYDWSGFYIGINGGGGTSSNCWTLAGAAQSDGCHNATGGTVGGQVGYRWQTGPVVFGVEAQGNWADFTGGNNSLNVLTNSNNTKIDAFGLFTGQVGYSWNNVLLYVKGGAAVTNDSYNVNTIATGALAASGSESRWGGTVGAGIEYGFTPNWSFALEYDHLFMGTNGVTMTAPAGALTESIKQDVDIFTARINYKFGGPVVAKY